jgi:hypothetical protein
VKSVGEPDALIGHVRFDERGWETERCRMAQATAPILDSTLSDMADLAEDVRSSGETDLRVMRGVSGKDPYRKSVPELVEHLCTELLRS